MVRKKYKTSQEAWEELHSFFLNKEEYITRKGGGRYGGQMSAYDIFIEIEKAWVLPTFDFGNTFGYRKQKWSTLIGNYIDMLELEVFKHAVEDREEKGSYNYNISMPFKNNHKHGKNCLLSLTASKRNNASIPVLSFNLRSSEITKRLLLDFLLVQRIGEYIYGKDKQISLVCYAVNMYMNPEAFTMYDSYKPIKDILVIKNQKTTWQKKVMDLLQKFKTIDVDEIRYKVHKRSVRQLQRPDGHPLSGNRPMLAKDLKL